MSGRIKVLEGGAKVQEADEPPLPADYYKVPSAYDASCGGYDLEAYRDSGGRCAHETFLCTDDALPKGSFGDCLIAMDCAMDYEMRSFRRPSFFRARRPSPRPSAFLPRAAPEPPVRPSFCRARRPSPPSVLSRAAPEPPSFRRTTLSDDPTASFMHQMIPHHDNAVNMAKLLMKADVLDAGNDPDGDIDDLLWDIVSVQPHQIHTMERWLASNGYGRSARCEREQDGCAAFKKKRKCLKDEACRWKARTCQAKKTDKCPRFKKRKCKAKSKACRWKKKAKKCVAKK